MKLAATLEPPYYAVIFSSILNEEHQGYEELAEQMLKLANEQPGFLGFESAREDIGISVSYWENLEAIGQWKNNLKHLGAQEKGKELWYKNYRVRISKVVKEYGQ
jgi:heme-degrading monooxygenase HmoA